MPRTPKQVIEAILANLAMARDAKVSKAEKSSLDCRFHDFREEIGAANAYIQCIDLINAEAASILISGKTAHTIVADDLPVRLLSDGTPVEMVQPFKGTNP